MSYLVEKNIPVPMRDGVKLATDIYRPAEDGPFPTLIIRLPYNKELGHFVSNPLMDVLCIIQTGYAVVLQDCRGRFASEGSFLPFFQERDDGVDTIAWAAGQPWSTGKVGLLGMSYLGTTQWLPAAQRPEALLAMAPTMTPSDLYGTLNYRQGAFQLGNVLFWALSQAPEEVQRQMAQGKASKEELDDLLFALDHAQETYRQLPLVNQPLLKKSFPSYFDWLEHSTYDDYWKRMTLKESYHQITVPALHIAGWYDLFL